MSWLDTQTRKRSVERSEFFRFIAVQPMYSPPHHSTFRAGKDLINGLRIKPDQASDQFSNIKNFQEKKQRRRPLFLTKALMTDPSSRPMSSRESGMLPRLVWETSTICLRYGATPRPSPVSRGGVLHRWLNHTQKVQGHCKKMVS